MACKNCLTRHSFRLISLPLSAHVHAEVLIKPQKLKIAAVQSSITILPKFYFFALIFMKSIQLSAPPICIYSYTTHIYDLCVLVGAFPIYSNWCARSLPHYARVAELAVKSLAIDFYTFLYR